MQILNVRRLRRHDTQNLVKTKQIAKEHSKSQNEQHIIESYQNNRPVNLHVQDLNKTCGLVARFHSIGFKFHTAFLVDNNQTHGRNDKLAEQKRSCSTFLTVRIHFESSLAGVSIA